MSQLAATPNLTEAEVDALPDNAWLLTDVEMRFSDMYADEDGRQVACLGCADPYYRPMRPSAQLTFAHANWTWIHNLCAIHLDNAGPLVVGHATLAGVRSRLAAGRRP